MRGNLLWTKGSPRTPLPKNFFQVGPLVPAAGRWGADNGPWTGKTGRGRYCAFLFLFLVRMACRAQRTFERMSGIKQKRGGQSAFRVLCHERRPLCQRAVLVFAIFCRGTGDGGCPASFRGVHPPAQSALGGGWGLGEGGAFARKPATEGGRRPCPLRRRELRASTAGQGPSFPQKLAYMWKKRRGGTPGIMRASASLR